MRFEVLGPLRLVRDGELIPLTSRRQRALLANLLLANETTLAADQLIEAVWGDELPSDPANTLQHGIAQLRKVLEPGRSRSDPPRTLLSDGAGYRLDLTDHQSDVAEFEELVGRGHGLFAQGTYAAAADAARSALGLWRGRAYADFAYTNFAMAEADRLDELKVQARELLLDAETAHNGPEAVVADLEALASEHPYREGIWARLMIALY
jgi:DNA-binding SARP family transcriptional activator